VEIPPASTRAGRDRHALSENTGKAALAAPVALGVLTVVPAGVAPPRATLRARDTSESDQRTPVARRSDVASDTTTPGAARAAPAFHYRAVLMGDHVPMSDEGIRAVTVGELQPLNSTIDLSDYDPEWPMLFEREAHRIRGALRGKALRVEHVGSTSVPELAAKPLIDILLVVGDSSDEAGYVPDLENAGYTLRIREPEWHEHRLFKGPDTNVNVHTFSDGCEEIERMIGFRDWLRTHDDDRELYGRSKRELAAREWRHVQNYADAKSTVVEAIIGRAQSG